MFTTPTLNMELTALFSPDYATSRQRFREVASAQGFELEAHAIGERGPDGDELTIDVAIAPGISAERALPRERAHAAQKPCNGTPLHR